MRLALAAGVGAAGLCLVLGMLVLAVTAGAGGSGAAEPDDTAKAARPVSNDRPAATVGSPVTTHGAAPDHGALPLPGRTVATFGGAHRPTHADFRVSRPGTWGLLWAFSCRNRRAGHLIVTESGRMPGDNVEIDAAGRTGNGTTWAFGDPGDHSLAISSDCSWSIRIVLSHAAGG